MNLAPPFFETRPWTNRLLFVNIGTWAELQQTPPAPIDFAYSGEIADDANGLNARPLYQLYQSYRFLTLLKSTGEEGGNLLDHTTVIYGSGMNSGERGGHSQKNLPLLVAGGSAWGLKHGQHLAHDPEKLPPLCNVLLTTIQKMASRRTNSRKPRGHSPGWCNRAHRQ